MRRWLPVIALALLTLVAYAVAQLPAWVWHPLFGRGYQLWSGIASDVSEITLPVTVIAAAITSYRLAHQHFECHDETCKRIGLHHVAGTPHRTCWEHHPILSQHPRHGVPLDIIHERHRAAKEGKP